MACPDRWLASGAEGRADWRQPVREVLVDYLRERQAAMRFSLL